MSVRLKKECKTNLEYIKVKCEANCSKTWAYSTPIRPCSTTLTSIYP